jgi:hypothetical protein
MPIMILVPEQDSSNILLHGNGRLCGEVAHFFSKDLRTITDKDFTTINGVSIILLKLGSLSAALNFSGIRLFPAVILAHFCSIISLYTY